MRLHGRIWASKKESRKIHFQKGFLFGILFCAVIFVAGSTAYYNYPDTYGVRKKFTSLFVFPFHNIFIYHKEREKNKENIVSIFRTQGRREISANIPDPGPGKNAGILSNRKLTTVPLPTAQNERLKSKESRKNPQSVRSYTSHELGVKMGWIRITNGEVTLNFQQKKPTYIFFALFN